MHESHGGWSRWLACTAVLGLATGGCFEVAVVATATSADGDPVTFDHGVGFDTLVMYRMEPRQSLLFARGFLYLPARESVERSMVWNSAGAPDPHRLTPAHQAQIRELADKVVGKYELLGAMLERRAIAKTVQIVGPGERYPVTTADLRLAIRLPSGAPQRPEFPDPGRKKYVVAATVVGGDGYELHVGRRIVLLRENVAIEDFKPRMIDLLERIERAAIDLQRAQ